MSGLRLFNLGGSEIRTDGSVDTMNEMTSIGASLIEGVDNDSITISSGTSIFLDTNGNNSLTITPTGDVEIADLGNIIFKRSDNSIAMELDVYSDHVVFKELRGAKQTHFQIGGESKLYLTRGSSTGLYLEGFDDPSGNGQAVLGIKESGSDVPCITFYEASGVYYAQCNVTPQNFTSDDRLKENEIFITDAIPTLKKLRPQIYDKKPTFENTNSSTWIRESGLIAQEVYYGAPELRHLVSVINATPDENIEISSDPSIDPDYSSWGDEKAYFKYEGLIAYLVKGIQEQQNIIEGLSARLEALENN